MARRPPYRRRRFAAIPRWVWLIVAIALALIAFFVVRHSLARNDEGIAATNRAQILRDAQTRLRRDPTVADLVYSPAREQWDVTPAIADVDPKAFGRYLCFTLGESGVVEAKTSVRVIDAAKLQANAFDYAAASRGTIKCEEGDQ
jgi:hypothetical protein